MEKKWNILMKKMYNINRNNTEIIQKRVQLFIIVPADLRLVDCCMGVPATSVYIVHYISNFRCIFNFLEIFYILGKSLCYSSLSKA